MRLSLPYLAYIMAFGVAPFVATFVIVGLDYRAALVSLALVPLRQVFINTLVLAFANAGFSTLIGLAAAVAVDSLRERYQGPLALAVVIPHTVPFVSAALIWYISLYGGGWGWFTYLLHIPIDPLNEASTAMWGVILVSVWGSLAFPFIIIYATLRAIPKEIKENALIDGLGLSRYYARVAIPMASKAILIAFVIELAFSFGAFDAPYVLTGGGPGYATTTLGIETYLAVYSLGSYSGGALVSAAIAALATVPALALFRLLRAQRPVFRSLPSISMPDWAFRAIMLTLLAVILFFNVMPVYWMFLVAFRPDILDFARPPIMYPKEFTAHYFIAAARGAVPYLVSSTVVSLSVGVVAVLLAAPAAYEVARGKASRWLLPLSIYLYVLPPMAFVIPLYLLFARLHLLNTWWALIMAMPLFSVTYGLWLMNGFFLDLPRAYDEVGELFGIRRRFTRLIMPLSRPVLLSVFLLATIGAWHALFYPLVFSFTPYNFKFPPVGAQTVTIYALTAIQESSIEWGLLASTALVAALPPMVLDFIFLSMISRGGPSGGLKFL